MTTRPKPMPSAEYLREIFSYDPETGAIWWKERFRGKPAGWLLNGGRGKEYYCLTVDYQDILAHRAIWKMMTGQEPNATIDHIDGNGLNNRWNNLREAAQAQQRQNSIVRSDSITGVKGVRRLPGGRYQAYITIDGRFRSLGTYHSAEAANRAYLDAAITHHDEFHNSG